MKFIKTMEEEFKQYVVEGAPLVRKDTLETAIDMEDAWDYITKVYTPKLLEEITKIAEKHLYPFMEEGEIISLQEKINSIQEDSINLKEEK